MKKINRYPLMQLELLERHGLAKTSAILSKVDLKLRWDRFPMTCALVCRRVPFEGRLMAAFYGKPVWKGYWFLNCHVAAWDRDPAQEFINIEPEPGDLFYLPHSAGLPPIGRNPQQRKVKLSCCLLKKEAEIPMKLEGVPFASIVSPDGLEAFTQVALKINERLPFADPPVLMRFTVDE